jgi:hypothetical protein
MVPEIGEQAKQYHRGQRASCDVRTNVPHSKGLSLFRPASLKRLCQ